MIYKIRLQNFRNLKDSVFEFSDKITVVVGPNASGKTNLLEAVYMLSTGKSFKASLETDVIKEGKGFSRVKGLVDEKMQLMILTTREKRKELSVNGVNKRLTDFAGNLKVVLFSPGDLDLVSSSPSYRRRLLDGLLSICDREYRRSLLSYEKALRARNKILLRIREEGLSRSQLIFWDQLLIKEGNYISDRRKEFIEFTNDSRNKINNVNYVIKYDPSEISESRITKYANAEVGAATTLVGPHRDDFVFLEDERNLASFGSRGEQRMAVLWLKLAELSFMEIKTKVKPTLLLDDIFSELDEMHREVVYETAKKQQTIITTADPEFIQNFEETQKIELNYSSSS